ncbi:MAG TPA: prepilin peptidase [Firmicutes bacterium]|nr:prepilin peptidase [Bacillota bacterium]
MGWSETAVYIFIFLLGLCFGSFLNVVVYRLPQGQSLLSPPSSCPSCGNRLGAVDLIPLLGYLLLKGRCRFCGEKISPRYPLVELAVGCLFLAIFINFKLTIDAFFYLTLLFILLGTALIDFQHRIVPNTLIGAGLAAGLVLFLISTAARYLSWSGRAVLSVSFVDSILGALVGTLIILVIILVSRGGMGAGDMKLMALIGFFVGLRGTAVVLLLGFIFGALVGITYMIMGRVGRKDALPFAPYLALAALCQVFWGDQIWEWYINLLS